MTPLTEAVLEWYDACESDRAKIAAAVGVSPGYVYTVLRQYRPDRKRKPHRRGSEKRRLILGLLAQDVAPPRVAFLAGCSRAYIHQLIDQEAAKRKAKC